MSIDDRDYVRERKLDYSNENDRLPTLKGRKQKESPNIPAWFFYVGGLSACVLLIWFGQGWH